MIKNHIKAGSCVAALLLSTQTFAVNGAYDYGFSEITRGMGGAGSALPQDAIITAINPAGLVRVKKQVDIGAVNYVPEITYDANSVSNVGVGGLALASGHYRSQVPVFFLPDVGANFPIDKKSALGISLYSLGGFGANFDTDNTAIVAPGPTRLPGTFGNGEFESSLKQALTSITYAHKFLKHSSWGVSLLIGLQTLEARGVSGLGNFSAYPHNISNKGTDFSIGAGARFGMLFGLLNNLDLAISYQPKVYMTKFSKYRGLFPNAGSFDMPAFGNIGLAWHIKHSLVLAGDVEGIWFKDIPGYGNSNAGILPGGTCNPKGSDKSTCMGGKDGAGFGWANDLVFKVGAQWEVSPNTTLRAGFNHGSKVLDNQYATENLITPGALIQDVWTGGFTQKLSKKDNLNCVLVFIPRQYITSINHFSQSSDRQKVTIHADGWGIGLSWSRVL